MDAQRDAAFGKEGTPERMAAEEKANAFLDAQGGQESCEFKLLRHSDAKTIEGAAKCHTLINLQKCNKYSILLILVYRGITAHGAG